VTQNDFQVPKGRRKSSSYLLGQNFLRAAALLRAPYFCNGLAPEARTIVAHGETVGPHTPKNQSSGRSGRNWTEPTLFRPIRGFIRFGFSTHDFIVGYFRSPLRGLALAVLFLTATAHSQTNTLTDAEIQGRALAQKMINRIETSVTESVTNTGTLIIRDNHGKQNLPLAFIILLTPTNWINLYEATTTNGVESISYPHSPDNSGGLEYHSSPPFSIFDGTTLTDHPFAGSDFSVGDLTLNFLHWPGQKFLKKDIHRSCGCTVLESTNPDPGTNGYSRVVSWVDDDSLGIVEAYAYDRNGKQLKDFYPKDFKKINGQWQVQTLVMENVQTGSKSRIEFDLKK
jgi:hypothetical protein